MYQEDRVIEAPAKKEEDNGYVKNVDGEKHRVDVRGANMGVKRMKLKQVLKLFKIPEEHLTQGFLNDLVSIAQGKVWSREFDDKSKALAQEINDEFDRISGLLK